MVSVEIESKYDSKTSDIFVSAGSSDVNGVVVLYTQFILKVNVLVTGIQSNNVRSIKHDKCLKEMVMTVL